MKVHDEDGLNWYLDLGTDEGGVGAYANRGYCILYTDDWDDNGVSVAPALPLAALDILLARLQSIRAVMVSQQEGSAHE